MTESTVAVGIFSLLTVKYKVWEMFLYFFRVLVRHRELLKIFDIHVTASEIQQIVQRYAETAFRFALRHGYRRFDMTVVTA